MKTYDSIVILGNRPLGPTNWDFPSHIYHSLDRAIELYKNGASPYIVLSGKWTINFDVLHIHQPFLECDTMAEYLLAHDIPAKAILREADSKDSISNLYYLKRQIFVPKNMKMLLFIAAEARLERIKFLCTRILGPDYLVCLEGVPYLPGEVSSNENLTLRTQSEFLAPMKDGDDTWLDNKFYTDPFYEAVEKRVLATREQEPFIHIAGR